MRYPLYDPKLTVEPFEDNTLALYLDGVKIATGSAQSLETESELLKASVAILNEVYKDDALDLIGATEAAEALGMKRSTFQWTLKNFYVLNFHYYIVAGKIYLKPETLQIMQKAKDSKR